MADFPRIKWLNIDGQQVPFTEPQHFTGNGDETVRTGKDNPLPVANYTKKGNIWLPVSEENPVPTQVTGSNVEDGIPVKQMSVPIKVKDVNADSTSEVAPGGVKVIEVRPPKGVVWRTPLVWVWARAITDGTEGTQVIELFHGINSFHYLVLRAVSDYPDNCRIMSNIAESATKGSLPDDVTVQQNAIQSLILTNDKPLYVSYRNDSDGTQSRAVQVRLIVTEERVSE